MQTMTATYSPEDNKLRLYSSTRLDSATYARVKAAGFSWAPKQELFVAPAWTPYREDLLRELCPDGIEDEDTSLVDRAERRAERFEEYSDARERDAERARDAVASIADGIPLGQPILVGHHSERHARKDAERIESGMRRAIKAWETAKYWTDRAAGAIRAAKYKELPGVRARRIKGLEADARKFQREKTETESLLKLWTREGLTLEQARKLSGSLSCRLRCADHPTLQGHTFGAYDVLRPDGERNRDCPAMTLEQVQECARKQYPAIIAHCDRWLAHLENRLAYERAMLQESGGLVAQAQEMLPGGRVLRRGSWYTILRVNAGSVSVSGHFAPTISHDEISGYEPPTPEAAAAVAKVAKLPPLCNYPGDGFKHMTQAQLDAEPCRRWSDFPKVGRRNPTEQYGAHRVQQTRGAGSFSVVGVYITDKPTKYPPTPAPTTPAVDIMRPTKAMPPEVKPRPEAAATELDAMRATLKAGVVAVAAPNLFPTPPDVARRLVNLAGVRSGHRVLEPSAGTGNLVSAIISAGFLGLECGGTVTALDINAACVQALESQREKTLWANAGNFVVSRGDFLEYSPDALEPFDRVIMNPPFDHGLDIKHIRHALQFLKPGGVLGAICANGPRQAEAFRDIADHWEDLEAGTFAGTGVRAAIVILSAGTVCKKCHNTGNVDLQTPCTRHVYA